MRLCSRMTPTTPFSRWCRQVGITTEKLAELTGYSYSACRAWRDGRRNPSRGARMFLVSRLARYKLTDKKLAVLLP